MKWSIAGLMFLGVVAAGCAAVLVASLRGEARSQAQTAAEGDVETVVALEDLPALAIVDGASVTVKEMPAREVPPGYLSKSETVTGRCLAVPIKKGQILTKNCLASETPITQMLPDGMRAVNLSLPRSDVSIVSPGSIVDVLVSVEVPSKHQRREAISRPLFHRVEVLAIDGRTSASSGGPEKAKPRSGAVNKHSTVTLMLSIEQVQFLQLARSFGTIGVALRNPEDQDPVTTIPTRLSELSDEYSGLLALLANPRTAPAKPVGVTSDSPAGLAEEHPADVTAAQAKRVWEVEVLRGGSVEKRVFSMPRDHGDAAQGASPATPEEGSAGQEETPSTETTVPVITKASRKEGDVQ